MKMSLKNAGFALDATTGNVGWGDDSVLLLGFCIFWDPFCLPFSIE